VSTMLDRNGGSCNGIIAHQAQSHVCQANFDIVMADAANWVADFFKSTSAYPVVSAKPDILGVVEPSTTTAGGDLKGPDKYKSTRSSGPSNAGDWRRPARTKREDAIARDKSRSVCRRFGRSYPRSWLDDGQPESYRFALLISTDKRARVHLSGCRCPCVRMVG
jgi:hypothetical protein